MNTCPNCGAAMRDTGFLWHCDYCGTERYKEDTSIIVVKRPEIGFAKANCRVDSPMLLFWDKETVEQSIKMKLCDKIAQFIYENDLIDIQSETDPIRAQEIYTAVFRYIKKGAKL